MAEEIKESFEREDKVVTEGKIWAILAYLWILCMLPLLLKNDNKFAHFHGKQGLVLFIGETAILVLSPVLLIIPILGQLVWVLGIFACGILSLAGIIQVLLGKYWKMPVVADIAEKFKI